MEVHVSSQAEQVKSCLSALVAGPLTSDPLRIVHRVTARALRAASGGRAPEQSDVEDLVEELVVKLLTTRKRRGAATMLAEWDAMSGPAFLRWLHTTLKNLAVDSNPFWDTQRALRDTVKAALSDGLPDATGLPPSLDHNGRFVRTLVAQACAALTATGLSAETRVLTTALMSTYGLGTIFCPASQDVEAVSSDADTNDTLTRKETSAAVVEAFLAEAGEDGRMLLAGRRNGFARLAAENNVAVSTIHARFQRVAAKLKEIATRLDADCDCLSQALDALVPG